MLDVIVLGGGVAGLTAARRAAELGAKTALLTSQELGGMGASDGPVPVRALAHAARLVREARQLPKYGIAAIEPKVQYTKLLGRVREVVAQVHDALDARAGLQRLGAEVHSHAGAAWFVDPHTVETGSGLRLQGRCFIICVGGRPKPLPVPGGHLAVSHSAAWSLTDIPASIAVIGSGATGAQVASVFSAFGAKVWLLEIAPHILPTEDGEVAKAVASAFRENGVVVVEGMETIERLERTSGGVAVHYLLGGDRGALEASVVVAAVGWTGNVDQLGLEAAGVNVTRRGYVEVNRFLQTSAPHIYAAGDIIGQTMLVPPGMREGWCAATNAVRGPQVTFEPPVVPVGSFTDPEYASVGMTEEQAARQQDHVVGRARFDRFPRSIIDGRTRGFCKVLIDKAERRLLGAHVVGERAVETAQIAAVAMASGLRADLLVSIPLSFPIYSGIIVAAAYDGLRTLGVDAGPAGLEGERFRS
jgi:pyruvate/2-oxoglutarate dehydrogenase complex dihydrolipoamide dehydrogenase (E3) component